VANRIIGYDRINRAAAREIFIRCALVEGDWEQGAGNRKFWERNQRFLGDLKGWGERVRRVDLVDEEAVFTFYDRRLGPDVVSTRHFDRWWKLTRAKQPELLVMRLEDFVGEDNAASVHDFPTVWHHAIPGRDPMALAVTYRFEPGATDDGATVHVPLAALNQVEPTGFDWNVPGLRPDLVAALLRVLPKEHRRELVPMNEVSDKVVASLGTPAAWEDGTALVAALSTVVNDVAGVPVPPHAFDVSLVPPHLRIGFSIDDEHGTPVAIGKDIVALRTLVAPRVRAAVARESPIEERKGIISWDFGDLPSEVSTSRAGVSVRGYPALLDDGESVSIRVFTKPALQAKVMRGGVRRLLLLAVPVGKRAIEQYLTNSAKLSLARSQISLDALAADCVMAAADEVIERHGGVVFTAADFEALVRAARNELPEVAATALRTASEVIAAASEVHGRLDKLVAPPVATSAADAREQLDRLVRPGFVAATGVGRLADVVRYVRAIDHRLSKLPEDPYRDAAKLRDVVAVETRYVALLRRTERDDITPEFIDVGWLLEELRVSIFAQQLGTARAVSLTKVSKALATLGG